MYCDHWVSNVVSREGFLDTLNDTLGFTPKVDFNVVAAGEVNQKSDNWKLNNVRDGANR